QDLATRMCSSRENDVYLPGFLLPANVEVVTSLAAAVDGAGIVLGVMPAGRARGMYQQLLPALDQSMLLVSATKGLETGSLLRVSELIRQVVGARFAPNVAVLSGPTFAQEVASGEPTALLVASAAQAVAGRVRPAF